MIETKVPKDIRKYDVQIIGPLTTRQLVLLTIAIAFDLFVYSTILKPMQVPVDALVYIIIFIDTPILAFTIKPMGMKMEQFLASAIQYNILAPKKRKARNRITQKKKTEQLTAKEAKKICKEIKKKLPEHPEYKAYK